MLSGKELGFFTLTGEKLAKATWKSPGAASRRSRLVPKGK